MQNDDGADQGRPLVSNRAMEIVVALVLLGGCAIVLYDSVRLGFGWREGEGPAPGYYPFWVAVILGVSSLVNLFHALRGQGAGEIFVSLRPFGRVLAVLVPSLIYVALVGGLSIGPIVSIGILEPVRIPGLGIYVASAIFIFAFMMIIGRENPLKAAGVAIIVPFALFLMFEKWFLVPLPKGPLEALLGY
jgi:hypothetical protein